jgi:hypothetical protein
MKTPVSVVGTIAGLVLLATACGSGSDTETAAPQFVEQGAQTVDTSGLAPTTVATETASAGAAEGDVGSTDADDGSDDAGAATTTLPQNEESQEEKVDDLFTAMRTFNSCLEDEGTSFLGDPRGAAPGDPASSPAYLEALQKCAAVSRIQEAMQSVDLGSEGKTPEEIEEQNRGLIEFTDCLKGRGWNPAPMEPDDNGLLQIGDLGAPEGENLFESDDMDECRRIGQAQAEADAEG